MVFIASSALSHALVRGRHHLPTPERIDADQKLIGMLERGAIAEIIGGFPEYSRLAVAETGGRALATLLGVLEAMGRDTRGLAGRQYGGYAQSSGSGNANVLVTSSDSLSRLL